MVINRVVAATACVRGPPNVFGRSFEALTESGIQTMAHLIGETEDEEEASII